MTSVLPDLEGWVKVVGAAVAVLMAVLVPVRSWIVEDRRYRAQTLEAFAAASRTAIAGVSTPTTTLADSLALSALAEAIERAARAVERLVEHEDLRDRDRLTRALEIILAREEPGRRPESR